LRKAIVLSGRIGRAAEAARECDRGVNAATLEMGQSYVRFSVLSALRVAGTVAIGRILPDNANLTRNDGLILSKIAQCGHYLYFWNMPTHRQGELGHIGLNTDGTQISSTGPAPAGGRQPPRTIDGMRCAELCFSPRE
jgi:hypothetical protein